MAPWGLDGLTQPSWEGKECGGKIVGQGVRTLGLAPDRHHWESHRFSGPHRGARVGPDAGHRPLRFCKVQKGEE